MDGGGVVGVGGAEGEEVLGGKGELGTCLLVLDEDMGCGPREEGVGSYLCCFGDGFTEDFDFDVAGGGV